MTRIVEPPIRYGRLYRWILEHRPESASLKGAGLIAPISQGDCDGLCGLYCIINAIRLVLAPYRILTHLEDRALFEVGVRYIAEHGDLTIALCSAVGEELWPALAEELRSAAEKLTRFPLVFERTFTPARFFNAPEAVTIIEKMISSRKAPMIFMRGKYRHYSVVSGYTPLSFRLFDSFGYQWVRRASCGASHEEPPSLHRFHIPSMIAVSTP